MHKEHNSFIGKNLQGLSSPQGASDPVQMNSRVNSRVISPFYSSSHNTSHPCFFFRYRWDYVEEVLIMSFLTKKLKFITFDNLFETLKKLLTRNLLH